MAPERSERPPHVAPKLKPAFEERDINRMWRALEDVRGGERRSSWPRAAALAGGALLACVLALLVRGPRGDAPLALRDDRALPAALGAREARTVYELDDGSHIVLERGARAEVLRNDGTELVAALRRGTVLVRGESVPDGVRKLGAGESIEIRSEPAPLHVAPTAPATAAKQVERPLPTPPTVAMKTPSAMESTEPSWFVLSRGGARLAALHLLDRQGGLRAVLERTREARLLLELSDVARAAGDGEAAALALGRAVEQAPDAPEAALAAFTLGRLELEQLGRPRAAAGHFAFVLTHPQAASLAEDALVRLVEAEVRAGDTLAARAHAAQYLARFPEGRRRDFVTRLTGEQP
jgi:transmembrane sensor